MPQPELSLAAPGEPSPAAVGEGCGLQVMRKEDLQTRDSMTLLQQGGR